MLTGLECPACGSQRAIHQLLHGNVIAALKYNSFLLVSLPYLFVLLFARLDLNGKFQKIKDFCYSSVVVNVYLVLIVVWWIVRNLI